MITTLMSWVCVWRGAANPAGSLKSAPKAPLAWLPHRSATLTPGTPGSRSVHFMSLAGMTSSRLCADAAARFVSVATGACARTATGQAHVTTSVTTLLALIEPSVSLRDHPDRSEPGLHQPRP